MTGPFDTVDDLREWLDEDPSLEDVEEALEVEKDNDNRSTAVSELNAYADDYETEDEDEPEQEGQKYVVMRPFSGNSRSDVIYLDPDDPQTKAYVRDGRIQRRP